ncbi:hypothetical protein [Kitasatospora sp. NPDC050543]|uniref:hypothetical protein n=1 Tax=Kitasatospora sp. NPDC050543 TaxID=3364054 RepID=UPI0037AC0BF2
MPTLDSALLRQTLRPVAPAGGGLLPVLPALAPLLPDGGLRRGAAVSVDGGDTGLLLALAAGAAGDTEGGGWSAAVGLPELGLAAAAGYGLDLGRLLLADDPGPHWAEVVSTLAGAVGLILLRPDGPVPPQLAARLAAILRRSGCVLLVAGPWPGAGLRLSVREGSWVGLGEGHGQLVGRQVEVLAEGRGSAARGRTARLWLPDEHGAVRALEAAPTAGTAPVVDVALGTAPVGVAVGLAAADLTPVGTAPVGGEGEDVASGAVLERLAAV